MNQEIVEILTALYRLEIVKELYDQRIIGQENYKEFLMSMANGIIETKPDNDGGKKDGQ